MEAPQIPVEVEVDSMVALVAQAVIVQTAVEAVQVTAVLFVSDRLYMHRQIVATMDLHIYFSCRSCLVHSRANNHLDNLLANHLSNLPLCRPDNLLASHLRSRQCNQQSNRRSSPMDDHLCNPQLSHLSSLPVGLLFNQILSHPPNLLCSHPPSHRSSRQVNPHYNLV